MRFLIALALCASLGACAQPRQFVGWSQTGQGSGASSAQDMGHCEYEAALATVNTGGWISKAMKQQRLRDQCMAARGWQAVWR